MAYNDKSFADKLTKIRNLSATKFMYDKQCLQNYELPKPPFSEHQQEEIVKQGEAMAKIILEKFDDFIEGIDNKLKGDAEKPFKRYRKAYNKSIWGDHDGCYSKINENRKDDKVNNQEREKNIAKALFNLGERGQDLLLPSWKLVPDLGEVMDYEIPLGESGRGRKIDLVSKKAGKLFIIELKKAYSKETLLRCLLESYTYSRLVDRVRLKESFGLGLDDKIVVCPLIFDNSAAHQELQAILKDKTPEDVSSFMKLVQKIEETDAGVDVEFAVLKYDNVKDAFLSKAKDKDSTEFDKDWLM